MNDRIDDGAVEVPVIGCHRRGRIDRTAPRARNAAGDMLSAAIHEAGHAVAYHRGGYTVTRLTVLQGGGGYVDLAPGTTYDAAPEAALTALLAGIAAEVACGAKQTYACAVSIDDLDMAFELGHAMGVDPRRVRGHWMQQARAFVDRELRVIDAVALVLVQRRELSHTQFARVVKRFGG